MCNVVIYQEKNQLIFQRPLKKTCFTCLHIVRAKRIYFQDEGIRDQTVCGLIKLSNISSKHERGSDHCPQSHLQRKNLYQVINKKSLFINIGLTHI